MTKIKKFDVLSVGKLLGATYAVIGFIFGAFFSLLSLIGVFSADEAEGRIVALIFGLGAIIALPVFYGVMGFIGGVITAWIYNLVAKYVGGIKIETEQV